MISYKEINQDTFNTSSARNMKRVRLSNNKSSEVWISIYKDRYTCLIGIENESDFTFPALNGVLTYFEKFIKLQEDKDSTNCIIIVCENGTLFNEYLELLKHILESIDHESCNDKTKINNINVVLKRHQYFYGRNQSMLNSQEQIGLLGELVYLFKILLDDVEYGLSHWIADEAGDDFLFTDKGYAVEIKATTSNRHIHTVNGLAQLSVVLGNRKDLLSLILRNDSQKNTHNITLPIIISNIERIIGDNPVNKDEFNRKLSKRGYSISHEKEYEGQFFTLMAAKIYEVNDTFPKITEDSFRAPLPRGVSLVRYQIDLSHIEGLEFDLTFMNEIIRKNVI